MPRIFISYRRADSNSTAGRLHDLLEPIFGDDNIFMDVYKIPLGVDFRTTLQNEISKADVVLIIIGPKWGSILRERRKDPNDFVRIELENALEQRKITIPVLVDGAKMPEANQLPKRIAPVFSYLNAAFIGDGAVFRRDVDELIASLQIWESLSPPPELPSIQTKAKPHIKISLWFAALVMILLFGLSFYVLRIYLPIIFSPQITPTLEISEVISSTPTKTLEMNSTSTNSPQPTNLPTNTPILPTATATQADNPTATNTSIPPTKITIDTAETIPTPTNTNQQPFVTVSNNVNLRSGPSKQFPVVGSAAKGDQLSVIASNGNNNDLWYLVKNKSGKSVWVSNQVAQINNVNQQVQVAATIPSPPEITIQPTSSTSSNSEPKLLNTFTGSLGTQENTSMAHEIVPPKAGRIRVSCTGNPLTPNVRLELRSKETNTFAFPTSLESDIDPTKDYIYVAVTSPSTNTTNNALDKVATDYECRVYWLG